MAAKDCPSLWSFGTTKTFKIPVEHLDFQYIEKCSDIKHLEKILCVLRSGEEGYYPELTEFCEKRLTGLAPGSRALRKDKPAATASSFTAEEWEEIDSDLKSWVSEIKREENTRHFHDPETHRGVEDHLPPVRGSDNSPQSGKGTYPKSKPAKKKVPRDYAEWDKFDVEKECSKIDEDCKEKTMVNNKAHLSKIETKIDTAGLTEKERSYLADRERGKGNEAFHAGDYEEAVMYYTRSLSALPTVSAYNNRAQAEIKSQRWDSALQDCEKALELEPGNIKALLRRATVYKHQNKLQEAAEDLKEVLGLEPHNDLARKTLSDVESELKKSEPASEPHSKGTRMVIEEVENSGDEGEKRNGDQPAAEPPDQELHPSGCPPGTTDEKMFQVLKEEGNQLVRDKNYKDAISKYSECLKINSKECAIYTNRALCYLKLGQFEEAKLDCDQALRIDGENVKACYRLALAQKGLENRLESSADPSQDLLHPDAGEATRPPDAKTGTAPPSKGRERRRIQVQEVNESSEEELETAAEAAAASPPAEGVAGHGGGSAECSQRLAVSRPSSAYEFGQVLNTICTRKDAEACAQLLAVTAPRDLPVLLSNRLEGDMLFLLVQSLHSHLAVKDPSLAYEHLWSLSKAQRFKMTLTLINKSQKEQMAQLLDSLAQAPTDGFTAEDVQALRREYEL